MLDIITFHKTHLDNQAIDTAYVSSASFINYD